MIPWLSRGIKLMVERYRLMAREWRIRAATSDYAIDIVLIALTSMYEEEPADFSGLPKELESVAFEVAWQYKNPAAARYAFSDLATIRAHIRPIVERLLEKDDPAA